METIQGCIYQRTTQFNLLNLQIRKKDWDGFVSINRFVECYNSKHGTIDE